MLNCNYICKVIFQYPFSTVTSKSLIPPNVMEWFTHLQFNYINFVEDFENKVKKLIYSEYLNFGYRLPL